MAADARQYGRHIYDLAAKAEEVNSDVVFYDGLEVEAMSFGSALALRLNARKLASLSKAGVDLVLASARSLGLSSLVDVTARVKKDAVVFSKPYAQPLVCKAAGDFVEC